MPTVKIIQDRKQNILHTYTYYIKYAVSQACYILGVKTVLSTLETAYLFET